MAKLITPSQAVTIIAKEHGLDRKVVMYSLRSFFLSGIKRQLKLGHTIELRGFGTFTPKISKRESDRKALHKLVKYRLISRGYQQKLRNKKLQEKVFNSN